MNQDVKKRRSVDMGLPLLVVAVLAAAAVLLRPMATSTGGIPAVALPNPEDDPTAAVVIGRVQSGGFSLLGFEFVEANHTVSVQLYVRDRCFERVALGDAWPPPFAECRAPVALAGTVSGGGTLPTGESLVVVDVAVGKECYDSTSPGDRWPPADTCP